MNHSLTLDNLYKEAIPRILKEETDIRRFSVLGIAIVFLIFKIFLPYFPYFYPVSIFCLLTLCLLFPSTHYIKKHPSLKASKIRHILATVFTLELIMVFITLYFYAPIGIYYAKTIGAIAIPFFCFYLIITYPLFYSKKYSFYFLFLSFVLLCLLAIMEYKGFYLSYSNYPISEESLIVPKHLRLVMPMVLGGFIFLNVKFIIDRYQQRAINTEFELKKLTTGLQKKVEEKTKELEESKAVLEIKVAARTRELKELTKGLEGNVKERTKELQGRVNELERFHNLTVGRELKMIELKKEIKKLKKKKKSKK